MVFLDRVINLCCAHGTETISALTNKPNQDVAEPEKKTQAPVVKKPQTKQTSPFSDKDCKYDTVVYKDLSSTLQTAVTTLGFTEQTWNDGEWSAVADKNFADLDAEEKMAAEDLGWSVPAWDHKYEDSNWADIPKVVQKAATSVGFTQESWDGDVWPEKLQKEWSELSADEKKAMNVLGYTYYTWA